MSLQLPEGLTPTDIMLYVTMNAPPDVIEKCDRLRAFPNSIVSRVIDQINQQSKNFQLDWSKVLGDEDPSPRNPKDILGAIVDEVIDDFD